MLADRKGDNPMPPPIPMRRTVFAFPEGDVMLTFPGKLSGKSVNDLEEYLKIFIKRAQSDLKP